MINMEDFHGEIKHTLTKIQEISSDLFDEYIDKPITKDGLLQMKSQLEQLDNDITHMKISYCNFTFMYDDYDSISNIIIKEAIDMLTINNVVDKMIDNIEEKIEQYIYNNFDRYYIQEAGECIYSIITEKAYEITEKVITEQENYDLPSEQKIVEKIIEVAYNAINFTNMYEIIDDILNQPITMEEKLADVGMSYKDFL